MLALHPRVVDVVWSAVEPLIPVPSRRHIHWVVIGAGSLIGCVSRGSCDVWSPGARGTSPVGSVTRARPSCGVATDQGQDHAGADPRCSSVHRAASHPGSPCSS